MGGGPSCQTKQKELYQQTGLIADTYRNPPSVRPYSFDKRNWIGPRLFSLFSLPSTRWVKRGGKHVYVCVYRIDSHSLILLYRYVSSIVNKTIRLNKEPNRHRWWFPFFFSLFCIGLNHDESRLFAFWKIHHDRMITICVRGDTFYVCLNR